MKKSKIVNKRKLYLIAIVIATFFMSIGYASINSVTLNMNGNANAVKLTGVFIYDASINSTSPANVNASNISIMYSTMMESKVVLNNDKNSTLTMNVTIYNKSENDVYFDKTVYGENFYDNSNIDFSLNGLTHGQKLAKNDNVTFTITFKYTDEYKNTNPTTFTNILNSYIGYNFVLGHTITYTNINNTSTYPSVVLSGENLSVTFSNDIPSDIKVTGVSSNTEYVKGTDYTYNNGVLTFNNVTEDLNISKVSSAPVGEPVEEVTENNDGSTTTVTTVTTEGGEEIVVGYEIDTSGTQSGSVPVPSGGIDTGILAFDGNDFEITLKARFTLNNCKVTICPILSISKKEPDVNGVLVYEVGNQTSGYGHDANGNNVSTPFNKFRYAKYVDSSSKTNVDFNVMKKITSLQSNGRYGYNASSSPVTLTFKVYYVSGVFSAEIYDSSGNLLAKPYNNTTISFDSLDSSFDNITILVGKHEGFGSGVVYNHNFDIIEFNVNKTLN